MRRVYQRKAAPTFLAFVKLLLGVYAAAILGIFVKEVAAFLYDLGSAEKMLGELIIDITNGITEILPLKLDASSWVKEMHLNSIGFWLPFLLCALVIALGLILVIVEGLAAVRLRFSANGAGTIRGIHVLYLILSMFGIAFLILIGVQVYRYRDVLELFAEIDKDLVMEYMIKAILIFAAIFISFSMIFCYNKDIILAMNYVNSDLRNENPKLRKTHLSGIGLVFGVAHGAIAAVYIIEMLTEKMSPQDWEITIWLVVYFGIQALRFLLVAASNRTLKRYAR